MAARNPNVGRHFISSPPARSQRDPIGGPTGPKTRGIKPQGSRQNQTKDSGGNIFNPDQKPLSGDNAAATMLGVSNNSTSYPAMNTAAAGNPLNAVGSGKVTKKVAVAKPSFYGR